MHPGYFGPRGGDYIGPTSLGIGRDSNICSTLGVSRYSHIVYSDARTTDKLNSCRCSKTCAATSDNDVQGVARLCTIGGYIDDAGYIQPYFVGLTTTIDDEGIEVAVAIQVAQCHILAGQSIPNVLTTGREYPCPIVQPHLVVCTPTVRHECIEVTIVIQITQRYALAAHTSQALIRINEDTGRSSLIAASV